MRSTSESHSTGQDHRSQAAATPAQRIHSTPRLGSEILRLSWPVVIGQLLLNGLNLADVVMLGTLGPRSLAAVGYATQCLFVVQSCSIAVGSACVAMMARALGAEKPARARTALASNLQAGVLLFAVPAQVSALLFADGILRLLAAPDEVRTIAVPYFRWTLAASVALTVCQLYEHALRATRDTRRAMLITTALSCVKLALNYVLIFGPWGLPALGLEGAGLATLGAYTTGALLFIAVAQRHPQAALHLRLRDLKLQLAPLAETLRLALPALCERLSMALALMIYFRFLANYGVATIAAYNVGVRILAFTWIPGIALSVAASTLVGLSLGASDPKRARASSRHAVRLGLLVAVSLGALFVFFRQSLAALFTHDAAVSAALDPFILLLGAALPFLVTHFTLSGALRGAGDTLTPLWAATAGSWLIRVPLGYLLSVILKAPLVWIWSIMVFDHLLRAVWLLWAFRYGSWDQRLGDR